MCALVNKAKREKAKREKEDRKRRILDAAADLLVHMPLDRVTPQIIDSRAGLTKGKTQFYYPDLEEIFFRVVDREVLGWLKSVAVELRQWQGRAGEARVAGFLAAQLAERETLLRVAALYPVVVERQLDMVTVLSFRRRLKDRLLAAATELGRLCPGLDPQDGARCLHRALLFAGTLSAPTDEIGEAYLLDDDPEFDVYRIDFQGELARVIEWGLKEGYRRLPEEV